MYALPRTNRLPRAPLTGRHRTLPTTPAYLANQEKNHKGRIKRELRQLGMTRYGLWKLEARYLPRLIHPSERLKGVVYGHSDEGSALLAATDRRVIYLDRKPFFVNQDEVTYDVVSGVSSSFAAGEGTVTLHTRVKDFVLRTFNHRAAERFVTYIEARCLENPEYQRGANLPVSW